MLFTLSANSRCLNFILDIGYDNDDDADDDNTNTTTNNKKERKNIRLHIGRHGMCSMG